MTVRRRALVLVCWSAAAAVAPACGGGDPSTTTTTLAVTSTTSTTSTTTSAPVDRVTITENDDGRRFAFSLRTQAELHLDDSKDWGRVSASGGAVELVQINYFTDPGYLGWEIDPVRPGTSTITAAGFTVTIDVTG